MFYSNFGPIFTNLIEVILVLEILENKRNNKNIDKKFIDKVYEKINLKLLLFLYLL
jgi:hypothetical protein